MSSNASPAAGTDADAADALGAAQAAGAVRAQQVCNQLGGGCAGVFGRAGQRLAEVGQDGDEDAGAGAVQLQRGGVAPEVGRSDVERQ